MMGNLESAKSSCEHDPEYFLNQWCLAIVYDKLGRHADAEEHAGEAAEARSSVMYLRISDAMESMRSGEAGRSGSTASTRLSVSVMASQVNLKTDPLMDPLRQEPRFQAGDAEVEVSRLSGGAARRNALRSLEEGDSMSAMWKIEGCLLEWPELVGADAAPDVSHSDRTKLTHSK